MAQNTQSFPSSGNPIELSETDHGSPRQNLSKQVSPPISLQNSQHTNSSSDCATAIQTQHPIAQNSDDQEFFKEMRGWLMIVAILAAGSTYQAGLNPPGGTWQDDNPGHRAGMPILHDKFFRRYQAFFYCNAISFLSSLVIIIFLMNKNFYLDRTRVKVLEITMVLDLFSFMAAYAVGSCRLVTSSIYVFLLMGGVFVYVISFARHYSLLQNIADIITCTKPCMQNTEQNQKSDLV